ncbi:MAG: DMT family protein [Bacteroidales bacterium]|nr:DMT family protein [Candidatus Sodaliphilus aphodohippi]
MNSALWTGLGTIALLLISNVLMTLAWYGHLKLQTMGVTANWPLYAVILLSWGIALLEYCFMIPANRIGFVDNGGPFSLLQLKIVQEALTLIVFTLFVTLCFKNETLHWNHYVSYGLLILAVFFAFINTK